LASACCRIPGISGITGGSPSNVTVPVIVAKPWVSSTGVAADLPAAVPPPVAKSPSSLGSLPVPLQPTANSTKATVSEHNTE
jgi:hypothetical protein